MQRFGTALDERDPYDDLLRRNAAPQPPRRRGDRLAALAAIVLLAAWAGTTTLYLLFRDDALRLLAERQFAITRAYDTQVAELQAEIVRLKSLKLVDQSRVDRSIEALERKLAELEDRHATISAFAASANAAEGRAREVTGSVKTEPKPRPAQPAPLSDAGSMLPLLRVTMQTGPDATEARFAALEQARERIELVQGRALDTIESFYEERARRLRSVFAALGIAEPQARAAPPSARPRQPGIGGPFLPWRRPPEDAFSRQVLRIHGARMAGEALQRSLAGLPVRRPVAAEFETSSGFGMRVDPFLGQLAMHTGVDFDANPGEPVAAAAAGRVVQSGRNGRYGIMVEIDHGNGLATRYAHLSAALVSEGATVAAGAVIGRVGSTGRSTAAHLHYEVRANGEPVDPQRYLRAGARLHEAR